MALNPQQMAELSQAVRAGNKILAIKLYREATGVGLAEAKAFVDNLGDGAGEPPKIGEAQAAASGGKDEAVMQALRVSGKISAIKLYREQTGAGLAESKKHVEKLTAEMVARGEKLPPSSTSTGCAGMVVLLLGLAVAAIVFLVSLRYFTHG